MRTKLMILSFLALTLSISVYAGPERKISFDEYKDKMKAGWIGQMVGVAWTAPTEFKFNNRIIPIDEKTGLPERMEPLTENTVNQSFWQDDLYVEMIFMESLEKYGLGISHRQAGIDFANSKQNIFCANAKGRNNTRMGIAPPWSGHPEFNSQPNAIDYQIEADYSGLIAPGLPQVPVDLGEVFGSMMNYSDGIYAGQFVGAMYSEAFFETDMRKVIEKGLEAIPAESQYAEMVRYMLQWSMEEPDWQKTWQRIEDKYAGKNYLSLKEGETQYLELHDGGIDVRVNGAYILMGLLYGEGDPIKTTLISVRCGKDSDCNPSNALGILLTSRGLEQVPAIFKEGVKMDAKFSYSPYNLSKLYDLCFELTKKTVVKMGGKVIEEQGGYFLISVQAAKPLPYFSAARPEAVSVDHRFTPEEMLQIKAWPRISFKEIYKNPAFDAEFIHAGKEVKPGLIEWNCLKQVMITTPMSNERSVEIAIVNKDFEEWGNEEITATISFMAGHDKGESWKLIINRKEHILVGASNSKHRWVKVEIPVTKGMKKVFLEAANIEGESTTNYWTGFKMELK